VAPKQAPHGLETSLNSNARYTATAVVLHWLVAMGLIVTFCVGLYMVSLERSPTKLLIVNWHRSAGITVLALALARLLWRFGRRPPPDVPMPAWQAKGAQVLHGLLYLLMLAVPLLGWAMSSAKGRPVVWFDLVTLPNWLPKDKALGHQLEELHGMLSWVLVALVACHVVAALKHHFIDKDGLLGRMRLGRPV